MECGPARPLAAVLIEPLIRGKVKDSDAWTKHSRVVCHTLLKSFAFAVYWPHAGSGVVRIDPLRFLAGCRTK